MLSVRATIAAKAKPHEYPAGTSAASGAMAAVAPTVGTVNVAEGGGGETIIVVSPAFQVFG